VGSGLRELIRCAGVQSATDRIIRLPPETRRLFCKELVNSDLVHFVFPTEHNGVGVDFLKVLMDALNQFFFRGYPDAPQHAPRHLAEEGLDQVEPGTMRGGEYKPETPRHRLQVGLLSREIWAE